MVVPPVITDITILIVFSFFPFYHKKSTYHILVSIAHATVSANQMNSHNHWQIGHPRFPALQQFALSSHWLLEIFVLWLATLISLAFGLHRHNHNQEYFQLFLLYIWQSHHVKRP